MLVREACQDGRLSLKDARAQLRWPDMDQLRALRDSIKKAVGKDDIRESIKQAIGEGDSGKSIWRFEDTGEEAGNAITEQSYSGVNVVDGSDCGVCGACDSDCNGMVPLPPVVDVTTIYPSEMQLARAKNDTKAAEEGPLVGASAWTAAAAEEEEQAAAWTTVANATKSASDCSLGNAP
eukprot:FR736398.1.p2 GENE.FR736398.1~~FR736398.1.p2  ORF type:complete len:179 (+),score=21.02 FR736398.1:59-595(+)